MSARATDTCPHGNRGTAICLYCRQESRDAARRRRKRLLTRFGLTTLGGAVMIALVVGALVTLSPASRTSEPAEADPGIVLTPVPKTPTAPRDTTGPSLLSPQVPPGHRDLGGGVTADRAGDEVTVTFDTDSLRTRYDWKFEGVVRATLPLVYGEPARVALDAIDVGRMSSRGNLLTELPRRGIRIPLDSGLGTIQLYPVVRKGRDGPLVVAYRARVIP